MCVLFSSGGNAIPKSLTIAITEIKGRLLTPEEGCGYSKVANTRIVGGSNAKEGKCISKCLKFTKVVQNQ